MNKEKPKVEKLNQCLLTFGLIGFTTEVNTISLDKNHIIKRVSNKKRNDFYKKTGFTNSESTYADSEFMLFTYYSEPRGKGSFTPDVERYKNLYTFFQLFKNSPIDLKYCESYVKFQPENKFFSTGFITFKDRSYAQGKNYSITKEEIKKLKKLWKKYAAINTNSNKAISVVLNRYYFSMDRSNPDDKIIDLMIAFEALFLTDSAELSFKLALRVSKFLEKEFNSSKVFSFMKKAYNLRSKIVHGAEIKAKDLKILEVQYSIEEVVGLLRSLLRHSILRYFEDYESIKIGKLIELIDESIIA